MGLWELVVVGGVGFLFIQHHLHQAHTPIAMHLPHLEPRIRLLDQVSKLPLRPLLRVDDDQHRHIQLPQQAFLIPDSLPQFRQDGVVDQQRGARGAIFEGGDQGAEDTDGFAVGPVVDALADEVGGGVADGLRGEEVVLGVGDAGAEGWVGEERGAGGQHGGGFVLHGEGQVGELLWGGISTIGQFALLLGVSPRWSWKARGEGGNSGGRTLAR